MTECWQSPWVTAVNQRTGLEQIFSGPSLLSGYTPRRERQKP